MDFCAQNGQNALEIHFHLLQKTKISYLTQLVFDQPKKGTVLSCVVDSVAKISDDVMLQLMNDFDGSMLRLSSK